MIVDAVSLLLGQLNQYIRHAEGDSEGTATQAIWGNIAQMENPEISADLENQLVLTLVNVEEEGAMKNAPAGNRGAGGEVFYRNPPLNLNLFLLFTANYRNYETALRRLTQVLTFFQGKKKFTLSNSPGASPNTDPMSMISLTLDLLSLSFEEVNHLWGSLGGKQLAFAAYRGRLVEVRDQRVLEVGGDIREVQVTGRGIVS